MSRPLCVPWPLPNAPRRKIIHSLASKTQFHSPTDFSMISLGSTDDSCVQMKCETMKIYFMAWNSIFDLENPLFEDFSTFTRELCFSCFLFDFFELMMNFLSMFCRDSWHWIWQRRPGLCLNIFTTEKL